MSESMDAKNINLAELDRVYNAMPEMDDNFYAGYQLAAFILRNFPKVEVATVRHGHWIYEAHEEKANCRWNVTAECSECCDEKNEVWAGFFPGVPGCIAKNVAIDSAKTVKLSNFCPNCGARMDGGADNG